MAISADSADDEASAGATAHSRYLAAKFSPMYDMWSSRPVASTTESEHAGSSPRPCDVRGCLVDAPASSS